MFAAMVKKWLSDFDEEPSRNKIIAFCANMHVDEEHKALLPDLIGEHFEKRKIESPQPIEQEPIEQQEQKAIEPAIEPAIEQAIEQAIEKPQQSEQAVEPHKSQDEFVYVPIGVESGKSMFVEKRRRQSVESESSASSSDSESSTDSMKMKEKIIEDEIKSKIDAQPMAPNPAEISAQAALSAPRLVDREIASSKSKLLELSLDDTLDIFSRVVESVGEGASDESVMNAVKKINAFSLKGRINVTVMKMYHVYVNGGEDAIKAFKEERNVKIVKKMDKPGADEESRPAKKIKTVTYPAPPAGYAYSLVKIE